MAVASCRNSFGPCAFECGPSTPVIRNCACGNLLAQQAHERNGAAFAHVAGVAAEEVERCARGGLLQPRRQGRRVPTRRALGAVETDLRAIGGTVLDEPLQTPSGRLRVRRRRQPQRQLHGGERAQDVARLLDRRQSGRTGDLELRTPGAVQEQLGDIVRDRRRCPAETESSRTPSSPARRPSRQSAAGVRRGPRRRARAG